MKQTITEQMEEKIITTKALYASEIKGFSKVPYGYINKTVCGCGMTSVAIEQEGNTIIAVPNVCLATNKAVQYPNDRYKGEVFAVCGGVAIQDIEEYIKSCKKAKTPYKILTTYDSVWKIEPFLKKADFIIDESDRILGSIGLKLADKGNAEKTDVITHLLNVAEKHKDKVSFISATPIDVKNLPKWVQDIDQIKIDWVNTTKVLPILMKRRTPISALKNEIIKPIISNGSITLGDKTFSKCIVFINSISSILRVCRECNLNVSDVGIICADNASNDMELRKYKRLKDYGNLPKFTFVTSTGFQGIDIYDNEAMNIVVSVSSAKHSMIDMTTDLKQATSRQRSKKNPNYNRYVYIYDQTVCEQDEESLLKLIEDTKTKIEYTCSTLNEYLLSNDIRYDAILENCNCNPEFVRYAMFSNDQWKLNELPFNYDIRFINTIRKQYRSGFSVMNEVYDGNEEIITIEKPIYRDECSFSVIYELLEQKLIQKKKIKITKGQQNCENYKLLMEYYKQNKSLTKSSSFAKNVVAAGKNPTQRIKAYAREIFHPRERLTATELKDRLNRLYKHFEVNRNAKVNDLDDLQIPFKKTTSKGITYYTILFTKKR